MQSSLKKSLYLGLAALSFASVASVTANSSNANAAKKHAAAKKVTYTTEDKSLDQTVVYKSTGKNAVYNKPVGKRSVVKGGSREDMQNKVNSKNTSDLFMAYQSGKTSKGVHYYKVVSFDKKVRGFVYNKGIAKTNNTENVAKPSNATGYLTKTDRFFNQAYRANFKNNGLKNDYKNMNIAGDQFTVADAVKVNNDQTYYYVKDTKNNLINGWVNSAYFSNTITDAAKDAQKAANAITVNFVDTSNYGSVLMTKSINPDNLTNGVYQGSDVREAAKKALVGTGYELAKTGDGISNAVAKGNTVSVLVQSGDPINLTPNDFTSKAFKNVGTASQGEDPAGSKFVDGKMKSLQLSSAQWAQLFQGKTNQTFDFNNFESALLAPGKQLNSFTDGNTTYTYNANFTKNDVNNQNSMKDGLTFDKIKANKFTIYYDVKDNTNNNQNQNNNGDANYVTNQVRTALNAYNNASTDKLGAALKATNLNAVQLNDDVNSKDNTLKADTTGLSDMKNDLNNNDSVKADNSSKQINADFNQFVKVSGSSDAAQAKNLLTQARNFGFGLARNFPKLDEGKKSHSAIPFMYDNGLIYNRTGSDNNDKGTEVSDSNKGTTDYAKLALAYNKAAHINNGSLIKAENLNDIK